MTPRTQAIVTWMRERVAVSRTNGIVLGLSGGIDSAVVAGLAARAVPGHVVGVMMPCHSDPRDEADARLAADHFGIPAILGAYGWVIWRRGFGPEDRMLFRRTANAAVSEG